METRARKRKSNIIMVVLAAVIVFCGIMAVGSIKGWFGTDTSGAVTTGEIKGIVNVERSGVAYTLKEDVAVQSGDILETKSGAKAAIKIEKKNTLTMNEASELEAASCGEDDIRLTLNQGEIFADIPEAPGNFKISFGENTADITGSVFSISMQTGSCSLNVYEGEVSVDAEDGSQQTVEAGKTISIAHSGEGDLEVQVVKLEAESLSNFLIEEAVSCSSADSLCFAKSALNKIADKRAEESRAAAVSAEDGKSIAASSEGSSGKAAGSDKQTAKTDVRSCTIQIRCDTILKNMGNLQAGKEQYVPSNGVILATSTVEFTDGETVFDVLKRVCSYTGIQLEYSWTPMYGSYYIEGINHLYEFDCGNESGWMYKVNGWFPNYGCSSYTLKDGDNIVWCYTCNGLGADVGGAVY